MKKALITLLAGAGLALAIPLGPQDLLEEAAEAFEEKTYSEALKLYRKALEAEELGGREGVVRVRIGLCLARLGRLDEALKELGAFAARTDRTLWRARALVERGVVSLTMPHYYTEKGGRKHWGRWVEGGTYHNTHREDIRRGVEDLEAARGILEGLAARVGEEPSREEAGILVDHFRCNTELAAGLEVALGLFGDEIKEDGAEEGTREEDKGEEPGGDAGDPCFGDGKVAPSQKGSYSALARRSARMVRAFDCAVAVQQQRGHRERAVLGSYLKGMAMGRYLRSLEDVEVLRGGTVRHRGASGKDGEHVRLPDGWNPFRILVEAREKARGLELEDEVLYALGSLRHRHELFPEAVASYRELLEVAPESPWGGDARYAIERITFPRLGADSGTGHLPGSEVVLDLRSRNLKEVDLQVYRLPASWFLEDRDLLEDDDVNLAYAEHIVEHLDRDPHAGGVATSLKHRTGDQGQHRWHQEKIRLPLKDAGTYLVEARGGDLLYRELVFVSEVALIRHIDKDRVLLLAVDARSGAALPGVDVVVRESFHRKTIFGRREVVLVKQGVTGEDGTFRTGRMVPEDSRYSRIESAAWSERGAALVPRESHWRPRRSGRSTKGYVVTDRPVYRPGDEVSFVAVLREQEAGAYEELTGEFAVRIRDAKGKEFFEQALRTDETGALDARVRLGQEPPLGMYRIQVRRGKRTLCSGRFRVEEYKKPEFEVTVEAGEGVHRLGGHASAKIQARYYFGEPVAGAEVAYRIFRERFRPRFRIREPYRFLYGSRPRNIDPSDRGGSRELVRSGKGRLDAGGSLVVEWDTAPYATRDPEHDSLFVVQADVTDAARRTISGAARIPVTRTAYHLHLVADRGFYEAGEKVQVEIQAQNTAGQPVATEGTLEVLRVKETREDGEVVEDLTPVARLDARTAGNGMGRAAWTADEAGRFRISYRTEDPWGEVVTARMPVWVHGPGFRARNFKLKNIDLVTEQETYEPGETVKILITSNFADTAILLCMVAGYDTLHEQVVRLSGKLGVVELKLPEHAAPNVHLQAMGVHSGAFFMATREVLVPPVERFLDVGVAFDKDRYAPGGRGRVTVTTRDRQGRPVSARVALACIDTSVFYIQQDLNPDIRRHFYGSRRRERTDEGGSMQYDPRGYLARDVDWGDYDRSGPPPAWRLRMGLVSLLLEGRGFGRTGHLEELKKRGGGVLRDFGGAPGEEARRSVGRAAPQSVAAEAELGAPANAVTGKAGERFDRDAPDASGGDSGAGGPGVEVRTDFRDTALWTPSVRTGDDGTAVVEVPFPDSLTRWQAKAVAWTTETRVGQGTARVVTAKDLMIRLQTPRFFVEGDRILVSGVVNSILPEPVEATVRLHVEGGVLEGRDEPTRKVRIPAGGEVRVDWSVQALGAGDAVLTAEVQAAGDGDAMRRTVPVRAWGARKVLTWTPVLRDGGEASRTLRVPEARNAETTRLEVMVQPSLAATLMDALPYLLTYPYGCTEQTVSRFVPAVTVARTLEEMDTSLQEIVARRGLLENAGQLGIHEKVLSNLDLTRIVKEGLERLAGMQNGDGGFGWWKRDRSSPYLTAYALQGLLVARDAGYDVDKGMIARALGYLQEVDERIDEVHSAVFVSEVLAREGRADVEILGDAFRARDDLSPYGRALLARALHRSGEKEKARIAVRNLADSVRVDEENGTVHWEAPSRFWWRWWNNSIETNVAVLETLMDVDGESPWIRPLVKWLVRNRQGNRWHNTRDTAQAVMALARYARRAGELDPAYTLTVDFGGQSHIFRVDRGNMFAFDNTLVLEGVEIPSGEHELAIGMEGRGSAYVSARLAFFTREEHIEGTGHEVLVERKYYRIEEQPGQVETGNGGQETRMLERRIPLEPGAAVESGTLVEVELVVTTRNDYEYLVFEDMKVAGFEPLKLRSGGDYRLGICSNTELRDERTVFFVTRLEQGRHKLSYRLRAEMPGSLRALPARAEAMYAPKLGGISDSFRVQVTARGGR